MIRWPSRLIDRNRLDAFLGEVDGTEMRCAGQNLILEIAVDEIETEDWNDGSGWLSALAPLRADVLGGDFRLAALFAPSDVIELRAVAPSAEPSHSMGVSACRQSDSAWSNSFTTTMAATISTSASTSAKPKWQVGSAPAARATLRCLGTLCWTWTPRTHRHLDQAWTRAGHRPLPRWGRSAVQ
jgi:hypothetical protein